MFNLERSRVTTESSFRVTISCAMGLGHTRSSARKKNLHGQRAHHRKDSNTHGTVPNIRERKRQRCLRSCREKRLRFVIRKVLALHASPHCNFSFAISEYKNRSSHTCTTIVTTLSKHFLALKSRLRLPLPISELGVGSL